MAQNYLVLPGIAPNFPESPRIARKCLELPGIARNCPELPGFVRIHPDLLGIAKNCMGQVLNGLLHQAGMAYNHSNGPELSGLYCQELLGIAPNHQELPGFSQICPDLPRFPWIHPESLEIACICLELPRNMGNYQELAKMVPNGPDSFILAWKGLQSLGIAQNCP